MAYEDSLLRRPFFPTAQRTKELLGGFGQSLINAITPAAGTPPPTMAGVTVPPAGASLGQLQFKGPLLGTGPMFGLRGGGPQPAAQPTQPATNYGLAAATQFPFSYNVAASQTPSMQYAANAPQQLASAFTTPAPAIPAQIPTQTPIGNTISEQRTITSTPRGNIYATPLQLENLNARTTAYVGRTPAQQQALLAQMRERGRSMAGAQETFFAQKASERAGLKMAEAKARSMGASSMDIMRAREATQPSTLGATRSEAFGYTQRLPIQGLASQAISEFTNKLPTGIATPSKIGGFNFGNIVGSSSGATLGVANNSSFRSQRLAPTKVTGSSSLYSNKNAEQRQATREIAKSLGMQPALSRGIQQEQEQYFRSRGFM